MCRAIFKISLMPLMLWLTACDTPNTRFSPIAFGDVTGLAAGGNLRLVTERMRPLSDEDPRSRLVMCSEPSPDYVVAFNRTADLKLKVTGADSVTGDGSVRVDANEQAQLGAGRTAGVLALRDGLYAACQAYANGVIGQDAYSVILSQYGRLIVAVANGTPDHATAGQAYTGPAASAFAAILVACLSENDPTRLRGNTSKNPLLQGRECRRAVALAASGGMN